MVFSSLVFMFVYLPITLLIMKSAPLKYRNLCLFILSLIFYGWGEPVYIVIMLISTVVDYFNGYMVNKYRDTPKIAKRFVIFSIVFNLCMLGFFKYFDFFVTNLNAIGFTQLHPLGLALPIGISFYTFQTMSYPIDIYRKQAEPAKNMVSFGAYVTMFPQLIAGPIVRYKDVAEQLNHRDETLDKFFVGVEIFMVGLAKKVLIANNVGLVWETISNLPIGSMSVVSAWIGIICYAFQIYFDFSGYSDMAIGLGKMLGFDLLENFNYPYIARSITDFWHRWHISLSTWFRDYVYIPLGGNRKGKSRQILNIMIVWLLTGFWHGASWNFMLWGVYFGILLIIEKVFLLKVFEKIPNWIGHVYTVVMVLFGWVLFAFTDIKVGINYFTMMFGNGIPFINDASLFFIRDNIVLLVIACIVSTPILKIFYNIYIDKKKLEFLVPVLVFVGLVVCTAFIVDGTYNPFLYFRF